jgi:hypothetical protein
VSVGRRSVSDGRGLAFKLRRKWRAPPDSLLSTFPLLVLRHTPGAYVVVVIRVWASRRSFLWSGYVSERGQEENHHVTCPSHTSPPHLPSFRSLSTLPWNLRCERTKAPAHHHLCCCAAHLPPASCCIVAASPTTERSSSAAATGGTPKVKRRPPPPHAIPPPHGLSSPTRDHPKTCSTHPPRNAGRVWAHWLLMGAGTRVKGGRRRVNWIQVHTTRNRP